jgi:glyoxylase-like metal-dependent hydrolase (beta-lactamase superfamily II)
MTTTNAPVATAVVPARVPPAPAPPTVWARLPLLRPPTRDRSGDRRLKKVADGCFLYRGFFSCSAVFETDRSCVVVDTQVTPEGGARLRGEIARVVGKPVALVVNTHYHGDHVGGNAAFSDVRIVASELTGRLMRERDEERYEYADTFGLYVQHRHETVLPGETFRDTGVFDVDGVRFEVRFCGRAETPDAHVVWVPDRRALACGDGIAVEGYPWTGVPFLDEGLQQDGEWLRHLRGAAALRPTTLLPGHGPALVGEEAIGARIARLDELFSTLFAEVEAELARGTAPPDIAARVDARLARFRTDPALYENVVSQRFAIMKAVHASLPSRRGTGWWHDLRPSVVRRVPRERVERDVARGLAHAAGVADVAARLTLVEAILERAPRDAAALGLAADTAVAGALATKPTVDATEYLKLARRYAEQALDLDPDEPLALAAMGVVQAWGAFVVDHPLDLPATTLRRAVASGALPAATRRRVLFFLGKCLQMADRDDDSDAVWRELLPRGLRFLFPLVRPRLRATP